MLTPRILWLFESANHSGVVFAAKQIIPYLHKLGAGLYIFALKSGEMEQDFAMLRCPVERFPYMGSWLLGRSAVNEAKKLGIQLVHAQSTSMLKQAKNMAAKLACPFIVTANRMDDSDFLKSAGFCGNGIIAVSDAIKERLANISCIQQKRIKVIPNAIDLSRFPRFNMNLRTVMNRVPVVGTFGQLAERKGQRIFLQAVKILLDQGIDAEFVLLGDGPDRPALRELAVELGVAKRVTFTPQTVSGQISHLDILVEPSFQEGLGLSVMQAMAAGVPVVASGVGGLYSLIEDGKTGIMVQAGEAVSLAEAIRLLLENPAERLELARQAREKIEKEFNADIVSEQLLSYYNSLLGQYSQ